MVWVFQWLRSCFFTLIFLEKRWNSGTHFDVQKYSHAKKVTWICHGISPWMRDCIIDRLRQNSVARMQFIQFFCNLLTLTYFDLFHKITTKTCYKSRRAADLAKHHDEFRRLMGSTDQADPSCIYFRISWILMERPWFYFFIPSACCRASEASNIDCFKT